MNPAQKQFSQCFGVSIRQNPSRTDWVLKLLPLLLLLLLPVTGQAQFSYTTNNGAITITGYTGPGGAVTIPSTIIGLPVIAIGDRAFYLKHSLTSVTIPNSVISIGVSAFRSCTSLTGVYFEGNRPSVGSSVFLNANQSIVYYLSASAGWSSTFAGRPAVLWNPQVITTSPNLGVRDGMFGFTITGTPNIIIAVEASDHLANPTWTRLTTHTLTSGSSVFTDPQWTTHPTRFYRFRAP